MFDRMLEMFDDLDADKLKDVVETVWEDRDKIKESVGLVWDNRDEIMGVIDFVRDNKDQLLEVARRLPEMLGKTGLGIAAAGESALKASGLLTGEDDDDMSAQRLAEIAADALERCRSELDSASGIIRAIAGAVDELKIPSLEPKYSEVVGFEVVTGVEFGEISLLDDAVEKLEGGAEHVAGVSAGLEDVSARLRSLGARLTETGGDLESVGTKLVESGGLLQAMGSIGGRSEAEKTPRKRTGIPKGP
jgi:hypothetical protein